MCCIETIYFIVHGNVNMELNMHAVIVETLNRSLFINNTDAGHDVVKSQPRRFAELCEHESDCWTSVSALSFMPTSG